MDTIHEEAVESMCAAISECKSENSDREVGQQ